MTDRRQLHLFDDTPKYTPDPPSQHPKPLEILPEEKRPRLPRHPAQQLTEELRRWKPS